MKRYIYSLLIVLFSLSALNLSASHNWGAEITYSNNPSNPNNYDISLTLIRDCYGIKFPTSAMVEVSSQCSTFTMQLNQVSVTDITPICTGVPASYCTDSTVSNILFNFQKIKYSASIDLGVFNCTDFIIKYNYCCRYGTTNSATPGSENLKVETFIKKNATANNSPVFNDHLIYGFAQQEMTLNFGGDDPDGDSLYFELVNAINFNYLPSFSGLNPVSTLGSIKFNNQTGLMTFTPDQPQTSVVAVKVHKYRAGVKIGEIIRDRILFISNVNNNFYPELTGVDSTAADTITVKVDSLLQFDIYTTNFSVPDVDVSLLQSLPNATLVNTGANKWTFTWTPDSTFVSDDPSFITIKAQNDICPLRGITFKNYFIKVFDPNSPVWPGDANDDNVANNIDLLTLGLAYGSTGPIRQNASLNWTAQPSLDWSSTTNGINTKHADTNGDGVVNAADTMAIIQNYGSTHNRTGAVGSATDPVLYIDLPDSVSVGQTVTAPIYLGDNSLPVDSIYGIAFTVTYDQNLVEPNTASIVFMPSWMGTTGVNTISLKKDFHSNGFIDAAVTRIDQNNVNGFGQIGTLSYVVPDDIAGKTVLNAETMQLLITNVYAITKSGGSIDISGSSDSVVVHEAATMVVDTRHYDIKVYPNPVSDHVIIDLGTIEAEEISVMDITGRQVLYFDDAQYGKIELQLTDLLGGVYIIQVKTAYGISSYKIHKP